MSVNAPDTSGDQGVNANTQVGGNVVTGFGPPQRPSVPVPQLPAAAQQTVQQLAPRATTFSGPLTPTAATFSYGNGPKGLYTGSGRPTPAPSVANQFFGKLERIAQQGADIASIPGNILLSIGKDTAQFVYRTGEYASKELMNITDQISNEKTASDLQARRDNIMATYKAGRMNSTQYNQSIRELSSDYKNLYSRRQVVDSQGAQYSKELLYNSAQTAILVLTLDSSGIAKGIGEFAAGNGQDTAMAQSVNKLLGEGAGNFFVKGGEVVSKLITKVPAFGKVVSDAVGADVLAKSDSLWAQSRSAAAAVFIKKPLLYNANIAQAKDVYDRMAKGDYGHALVGIGLIGAQALGGGPFGYARAKFLGGYAKLGELAFGEGSFLDELSGRVFNGDRAGIYNYLNGLDKSSEEYTNAVQRLKELEHVNMAATGGRVVEAVDRVTSSLTDAGFDLQGLTHAQVVGQGIGWAEAAARVDHDIKAGLVEGVDRSEAGRYAVGKFDTASKAKLATMFEQVDKALEGGTQTSETVAPAAADVKRYMKTFRVDKATATAELTTKAAGTVSSTATMADKVKARTAAWQEFVAKNPNVPFTNNVNMSQKIEQLITNVEDAKGLRQGIMDITTANEMKGLSPATKKFLTDRGFVLIRPQANATPFVPFEETSKVLRTNFAQPDEGYFAATADPLPILSHIGSAFERAGLSTRDATQLTQNIYHDNLAQGLGRLSFSDRFVTDGHEAADNILNTLNTFARNRKLPVTDLRQLPIGGIKGAPPGLAEALNISRTEAHEVASALNDAMLRVPLQYRGLGDRLVDYNLKYNPAAGGYARVQSAFRYAWNPFFRWKLDTKTEVFSQLEAGGKSLSYPVINKFNELIFPGMTKRLQAVAKQLEESGVLTTGFGGEGAQDVIVGQIGARLTKAQRISIAGVADAMATTQGKTVEQLLRDNPQQVTDALRILVQYPREGFVNSPLVRTLNVAFFPVRFNVKVAELSAKALAKQSPYMQVAIIKGMYNFNAWLKTDEGTAWQANHSDVLSLMEYISPLHTLTQVLANLRGNVESVGDLGELGGLPFGFIPQMLSSQGVIPNLNTPYVNPSSGTVTPDYIPQTAKARLATAIQDLLMSVFTYPGQTIGLPGKAATVRKVVNAPLGVSTKDYNKVDQTSKLSANQRHQVAVVSGLPQNQSPLGAPAFTSDSGIYHEPAAAPQPRIAAPLRRGTPVPVLNKLQIQALRNSTISNRRKKTARPF